MKKNPSRSPTRRSRRVRKATATLRASRRRRNAAANPPAVVEVRHQGKTIKVPCTRRQMGAFLRLARASRGGSTGTKEKATLRRIAKSMRHAFVLGIAS